MEIERKFLIEKFPNLPLKEGSVVEQGYLSDSPEVRFRRKMVIHDGYDKCSHICCVKGDGDLTRPEVEFEIDEQTYLDVKRKIGLTFISKACSSYELPGGLLLECSLVDSSMPTKFMYAEVEFETEEQASAFIPPSFLGEEVTKDKSYKMKNYWKRTRLLEEEC